MCPHVVLTIPAESVEYKYNFSVGGHGHNQQDCASLTLCFPVDAVSQMLMLGYEDVKNRRYGSSTSQAVSVLLDSC